MTTEFILGILLPFLGTAFGAACVFAMQGRLHTKVQRALTGFASGVMVAASVWSLLVPAMEQAEDMGRWAFLPAVIGFWLGVLFLLVLDRTIPHLHQNSSQPEGLHTRLKRTTMLVLAVTLHNVPEGMAVGVVLAGWMAGNGGITAAGTLALSIGIAIGWMGGALYRTKTLAAGGDCCDFYMENVIALREKHIPKGEHEQNVVCDLNDFSWFDQIDFDPAKGVVFTAGGLFYYFETEQVRCLLCAMAERFPGGMITFDAVNSLGLEGVNAEVRLAGNNSTKSFFSLERPKEELENWSPSIINVMEKDYADGYLKGGYRKTPITRLFNWIMRTVHMSFMLHVEFQK